MEAVGKRKLRELQRCVVDVLLENMALDEPHADLAAYVGRHLAHHVRGALQPEVSLLRDEALLQPLLHHPHTAVPSRRAWGPKRSGTLQHSQRATVWRYRRRSCGWPRANDDAIEVMRPTQSCHPRHHSFFLPDPPSKPSACFLITAACAHLPLSHAIVEASSAGYLWLELLATRDLHALRGCTRSRVHQVALPLVSIICLSRTASLHSLSAHLPITEHKTLLRDPTDSLAGCFAMPIFTSRDGFGLV